MSANLARAMESFVTDTYGRTAWRDVVRAARLDFDSFELLFDYPATITEPVLDAAAARLQRSRADLMDDLGTYLVSHPRMVGIRRLLRFGGGDFETFLDSLRELPDRARLVLPDLHLPSLRLEDEGDGAYSLDCSRASADLCGVLVGAIRAMADDYGALVTTELASGRDGGSRIEIVVLSSRFTPGRAFELAGRPA